MSNPNPYGSPEQPHNHAHNPYGTADGSAASYGDDAASYAAQQPQGNGGNGVDSLAGQLASRPRHQIYGIGVAVLALLQIIFGFLTWVSVEINSSLDFLGELSITGTVNGWGNVKVVTKGFEGFSGGERTDTEALVLFLSLLTLALLVVAAVLLFLRKGSPKIAGGTLIVSGAIGLINLLFSYKNITGNEEPEDIEGAEVSVGMDAGFWLSLVLFLVTIACGVWLILKVRSAALPAPASAGYGGQHYASGVYGVNDPHGQMADSGNPYAQPGQGAMGEHPGTGAQANMPGGSAAEGTNPYAQPGQGNQPGQGAMGEQPGTPSDIPATSYGNSPHNSDGAPQPGDAEQPHQNPNPNQNPYGQ